MKIKKIICVLSLSLFFSLLTACTKKGDDSISEKHEKIYIDGIYSARSSIKDDWGGFAEVKITIQDGKITECKFYAYDKNKTLKDENYGKADGVIKNEEVYKTAQKSIELSGQYEKQLIDTQELNKVETVSGATFSYTLFKNAVEIALKQAEAAN